MHTTDYLTGKLSPELRIMIFQHVFGTCLCVRRPTGDKKPVIANAILATSRQVSREALETFYNDKLVALDVVQLLAALRMHSFKTFARDVTIIDATQTPSANALRSVLKHAVRLPRLESVTIASDCLMYGRTGVVPQTLTELLNGNATGLQSANTTQPTAGDEQSQVPTDFITVRKFAEEMGLGIVTCTNIGIYSLTGDFAKVSVYQSKLVSLWGGVVEAGDGYMYRALPIATMLRDEWHLRFHNPAMELALVSHDSLEQWLGMYQFCRMDPEAVRSHTKEELWEHRFQQIEDFVSTVKQGEHLIGPEPAMNKLLCQLGPGDDPKVLEWATKFLSLNVGTCQVPLSRSFRSRFANIRPQWCDLEGEDHIRLLTKGKGGKKDGAEAWIEQLRVFLTAQGNANGS